MKRFKSLVLFLASNRTFGEAEPLSLFESGVPSFHASPQAPLCIFSGQFVVSLCFSNTCPAGNNRSSQIHQSWKLVTDYYFMVNDDSNFVLTNKSDLPSYVIPSSILKIILWVSNVQYEPSCITIIE